jgi:purine-binding chemotaxis protein CheW
MQEIAVERAARKLVDCTGKYLTIELGNEQFGIPVSRIREIIGYQEVSVVPQTAAHVKGVINLRGKVISVVDLRLKFGLVEKEHSQRTCIIVVQLEGRGGPMLMGVIVDGVSEVVNLSDTDLEPAPDFGDDRPMRFLAGMAKIKERVVILLDIDEVLMAPPTLAATPRK